MYLSFAGGPTLTRHLTPDMYTYYTWSICCPILLMVQKSQTTSWRGKYLILYRVFYIPGGFLAGCLNHVTMSPSPCRQIHINRGLSTARGRDPQKYHRTRWAIQPMDFHDRKVNMLNILENIGNQFPDDGKYLISLISMAHESPFKALSANLFMKIQSHSKGAQFLGPTIRRFENHGWPNKRTIPWV